MGGRHSGPLRPQFDRRLRLGFHGAAITSEAGLLAYRELDDAFQLTDTAADVLHDTRTGRNTRHGLVALLRQSLFSRLAGYEDLNDTQGLRADPAMCTVVGGRARDHAAASTHEIGRFETETLTTRENLNRLMGEGRAEEGRRGIRSGIRLAGRSDLAVFPLTLGCGAYPIRAAGEPDELPDNEANAHLGNPG